MEDKPEEYVEFMAKYKDWISIKKMSISHSTKPEEVVYHMAGIRSAIDGKAFKFLGIDTEMLDAYAESSTRSAGRGYSGLSRAVLIMESDDSKSIIEKACQSATMAPFARSYLLNRIISAMKFETSVSQLGLSKVFPDLKPPKAPGRLGKATKPK